MKKEIQIQSPLMSEPVELIEKIEVESLINRWTKKLDLNLRQLFKGLKYIELYEGKKSGIQFFHPASVAGDESFYEELQKKHWYYPSEKWEFDFATTFLESNSNILEVGCGEGFFLRKAKAVCKNATGLELNPNAVRKALETGLDVRNITIQDFALTNIERFDLVVSFQVMEHVSNPIEFITAQLECLKIGGKLIISVPNNGDFYGKLNDLYNYPPHHMLRWTEQSLTFLKNLFRIKLISLVKEPLRKDHLRIFCWTKYRNRTTDCNDSIFIKKIKSLFSLIEAKILEFFPYVYSKKPGHTVLVVFQKE